MMCAPTLNDDVNGQYRGMDKKVHTLADGEHNYSTYSFGIRTVRFIPRSRCGKRIGWRRW